MSFQKITNAIDRLITWASYLAVVMMVFSWLSVCAEVIMRYFLSKPIPWVTEITEYILVQMTFLGTAWLLRKEGHVSVDIVTSHLKPKVQNYLLVITSLIGLVVSIILVIWGGIATWGAYRDALIVPKQLGMPKYLVMIVIPIGSFLLTTQFWKRTYHALLRFKSVASDLENPATPTSCGTLDSH